MKNIIICFGGISPEHEVSIITGLQVLEHIDRTQYNPTALYITNEGIPYVLQDLVSRHQFLSAKKNKVKFGIDEKGGYIQTDGIFSQKIYPECAYFAFHGGAGESGQLQGLFDSLQIPYTSSSVESSAVSMNKNITKQMATHYGINVIDGVCLVSADVKRKGITQEVMKKLKLPVIVKPAHLGSSIGVTIAKTEASLQKALLIAAQMDSEIVIEKLIENYIEYNCAVRCINGKKEASEVERPVKKDEILSFADKYERGGKKMGGMASLTRELPAKIDSRLRKEIQETAIQVFDAVRAKGMVRCDFMYSNKKLYLIEVNPIPGSMAFYLWEASGIGFDQQITDLIEESIQDWEKKSQQHLTYKSDIVSKFVGDNS